MGKPPILLLAVDGGLNSPRPDLPGGGGRGAAPGPAWPGPGGGGGGWGKPPILLRDVDGVLNSPRHDLPEGWRQGSFNGYRLSRDPPTTAPLPGPRQGGRGRRS